MTDNLPLKRFILMGGSIYYACGGFEDFLGSYEGKDEAMTARDEWIANQDDYHWAHVADTHTGEYWSVGQAEATMARFSK